MQAVMYSVLMIPVGLLPYMFKISGAVSLVVIMLCNISMVLLCVRLLIKMDIASAKKVMFGSYFYLMIVFVSLYADKWRAPVTSKPVTEIQMKRK